jgi:hypothetical protein
MYVAPNTDASTTGSGWVFFNNGTRFTRLDLNLGIHGHDSAVYDINGDGRSDIFTTGSRVSFGNANRTFSTHTVSGSNYGGTAGSVQVVNYSTTSLKVNGSGLNNAVITEDQAGNTLLANIFAGIQGISSNFASSKYGIKAIGAGPDGTTNGAYVRLFDPNTNLLAGVSNGGGANALLVQVLGAPIALTATIGPSVTVTNTDSTPLYIRGSTGSPVSITGITLESLLTTINNSGISGSTFTSRIPVIETLLTNGTAKVKLDSYTLPTTLSTGLFTATTSPTAVSVSGFTCARGVNLKSNYTNTFQIFVGITSAIGSTNGYPIDPGENLFLEISNLNKLFAVSGGGSTGQKLYFLAN